MIRRSGVRRAVSRSNTSRGTLRRSASGHSDSRQLPKLAAAARIASACMAGWPEEPDSPLQGGGEPSEPGGTAGTGAAGACEIDPVVLGLGLDENSDRKSNPSAGTAAVTVKAT